MKCAFSNLFDGFLSFRVHFGHEIHNGNQNSKTKPGHLAFHVDMMPFRITTGSNGFIVGANPVSVP
jgi:hypothetical protein